VHANVMQSAAERMSKSLAQTLVHAHVGQMLCGITRACSLNERALGVRAQCLENVPEKLLRALWERLPTPLPNKLREAALKRKRLDPWAQAAAHGRMRGAHAGRAA